MPLDPAVLATLDQQVRETFLQMKTDMQALAGGRSAALYPAHKEFSAVSAERIRLMDDATELAFVSAMTAAVIAIP